MSRATRPLRRVRDTDRDRLVELLRRVFGLTRRDPGELVREPGRAARALATRPAVVRRCLLGRVVSARAAGRVLARAA